MCADGAHWLGRSFPLIPLIPGSACQHRIIVIRIPLCAFGAVNRQLKHATASSGLRFVFFCVCVRGDMTEGHTGAVISPCWQTLTHAPVVQSDQTPKGPLQPGVMLISLHVSSSLNDSLKGRMMLVLFLLHYTFPLCTFPF
jgi:hypothetical protein